MFWTNKFEIFPHVTVVVDVDFLKLWSIDMCYVQPQSLLSCIRRFVSFVVWRLPNETVKVICWFWRRFFPQGKPERGFRSRRKRHCGEVREESKSAVAMEIACHYARSYLRGKKSRGERFSLEEPAHRLARSEGTIVDSSINLPKCLSSPAHILCHWIEKNTL